MSALKQTSFSAKYLPTDAHLLTDAYLGALYKVSACARYFGTCGSPCPFLLLFYLSKEPITFSRSWVYVYFVLSVSTKKHKIKDLHGFCTLSVIWVSLNKYFSMNTCIRRVTIHKHTHMCTHTHGRLEQMLFKRETTRRILEWSCAEKWATTYQTLTLFISGQTSITYLQSSCAVVMLHDEKSSGYFGNVPFVLWGSTEHKSKDEVLDNNSLYGHVVSLCLSLLIFKLNTNDQVMVKGFSCTCDSVMGGQERLDRTIRVFLFLFRHMATKHHPIVI